MTHFPPRFSPSGDLQYAAGDASLALGRLDAISSRPDAAPLRDAFITKEARLSAQIEGIVGPPAMPAIAGHRTALEWGLLQIRNGFPLSTRLLRGVYARLADLPSAPPLPDQALEPMAALERFLTDLPERTPPLIKAGIGLARFAAIAPFPDQNGRIGRLLVPLILCADGALHEPVLYFSHYHDQHRDEGDALLAQLRQDGAWEGWLTFFARGVTETASSAIRTTEELLGLFAADRERVLAAGRPTKSTLALFDAFRERPINTAPRLVEQTGLTLPTVISALERLQSLGIISEITGKRRNRTYRYSAYIERLGEGTEPV